MKLLRILLPLGICLLSTALAQAPSPTVVVQNFYWAKESKSEEVFRWRVHASDVRESLGLLRGRVLRRQGDSKTLADVVWECEYPDPALRAKEVAELDKSAEFREVQAHMSTLIQRFERATYTVAR